VIDNRDPQCICYVMEMGVTMKLGTGRKTSSSSLPAPAGAVPGRSRPCSGKVMREGVWLLVGLVCLLGGGWPSQASAGAYPRLELGSPGALELRVGLASQHWFGPDAALAAVGDRAGMSAQVGVRVTTGALVVVHGAFYPSSKRIGPVPPCAADTYLGDGVPSEAEIAEAAACHSAGDVRMVGLGVGWTFRLGPHLVASQSITADATWLGGIVVPLDDEETGGVGLASALVVGPGLRARFAWMLRSVHVGVEFRSGLGVVDAGPAVQVYVPLGIGLDLGLGGGVRSRSTDGASERAL